MTIEVVENRTFSGEAAKFQSSDHQTAPIHASSLQGEVFLPFLLFNRPNPLCQSSLQNNTAFSESYGHHTSVTAWADQEHLVLFLERRRKPQPYTKQPQRVLEQPRVFWGVASPSEARGSHDKLLDLETLLMAGALWWQSLNHVTRGRNQNNLTTCVYTWGMCSKSMWCQVQFTTRIVTASGF